MEKEKETPKANPIEFAYVRIALEVMLEISLNTIDALEFNVSRYIRIKQASWFSVVFLFFLLSLRAKLLFLNILKLF